MFRIYFLPAAETKGVGSTYSSAHSMKIEGTPLLTSGTIPKNAKNIKSQKFALHNAHLLAKNIFELDFGHSMHM